MTSECLQGWMVSILHSKKGAFSSVTVQFWYSAQMSSNICLEESGLPIWSQPLIQRRGVQQYSSYEMQIEYCLNYSYFYQSQLSPVTSRNPNSFAQGFSMICCSVSCFILVWEAAADIKYCLFASGSSLLGLDKDFCHFHPKFVSWSPACTNCSGDRIPFPQKSFYDGVNWAVKKFLIELSIDLIIIN